MLPLIIASSVVFVVLCLAEFGWRRNLLHGEFGRKFVHITVGTFVAFWPFFLTWNQIRFMSLAFLVVVIISQLLHLFQAIGSVQRPTYGEVFFAIVVGLLTFITTSKAIYAAAILQMSLADGLAAVLGSAYGRTTRYHVFGQAKSLVGTLVFFVVSLGILITYSVHSVHGLPVAVIGLGALATTALENFAVFGLDNVAVPLLVALLLMHY